MVRKLQAKLDKAVVLALDLILPLLLELIQRHPTLALILDREQLPHVTCVRRKRFRVSFPQFAAACPVRDAGSNRRHNFWPFFVNSDMFWSIRYESLYLLSQCHDIFFRVFLFRMAKN